LDRRGKVRQKRFVLDGEAVQRSSERAAGLGNLVRVARRQCGKLPAAISEESIRSDEQGIGTLAREGGKGRMWVGIVRLKMQR
jgi:hypothetical protein